VRKPRALSQEQHKTLKNPSSTASSSSSFVIVIVVAEQTAIDALLAQNYTVALKTA